jgi:LysM repeat protein
MNNESPLIPKGSLMEQKNKGRMRFKIAVFVVLGLHGVAVLALLMQGCKDRSAESGQPSTSASEPRPEIASSSTSNSLPSLDATNTATPENTNVGTAAPPATGPGMPSGIPATGPAGAGVASVPAGPGTGSSTTVTGAEIPPLGGGSDYKVVKGDTLALIAKHSHVSLSALTAANPGVDPKKLKIGQTIHLPISSAPASALASGTPGTAVTSAAPGDAIGSEQVYVVKSGDSLIKIAGQFGVKVKALRAANTLKSDKIRVGQKLKIPAKPAASTTPATAAIPPVGSGAASVPAPVSSGPTPSNPTMPAGR